MTRLSNRQYPMLRLFADDLGPQKFMSIEQAQHWDQRPFRSMLIQKWVVYKPGKGFHVTKLGVRALNEFLSTDIARKHPEMPLTVYFDPDAYGLKHKVREMPRKAHAA